MAKKVPGCLFFVLLAYGQTQIDLNRQARNILPYASGGTNAASQIDARKNVGTPHLVATDFSGADIGAKVNNAFASFGAGKCGTVVIPAGVYTHSTQIFVPTGCVLEGAGRGFPSGAGDVGAQTNTTLIYNGAPATSAVVIMYSDLSASSSATVRGLTIQSNASNCPNDGWLQWNPDAAGSNKWQCAAYGSPKTVTGATNATPVQITSIGHGFSTGDRVLISGVGGNNGANGEWRITLVDADHFTLDGSAGNAAYSSGGKAERIAYSAPVPHLAAIQHGQTDPTALADGIHITIRDIFINGFKPATLTQGAFQAGVYLNGCEECLIDTVYVQGATDGFLVGAQSNGVTFNTITARINRRAGFHYRGQNNFQVYGGLFESNVWLFGSKDVDKHGHGILAQQEPNVQSTIIAGGEFDGTYFEANDCDLCSPLHIGWHINVRNGTRDINSGYYTNRAQWNGGVLFGCGTSMDATLSLLGPFGLTTDCDFTGTFPQAPGGSGAYRLVQVRGFAGGTQRVYTRGGDNVTPYAAYEFVKHPADQDYDFIFRTGSTGFFGLDPWKDADSNQSYASPRLRFRASQWGGAQPQTMTWSISGTTFKPGGSQDTVSKLAIDGQGSNFGQNFSFREKSVFRVAHNTAGDTPKIQIGHNDIPSGIPDNDTTPSLDFLYRSDADLASAGAWITASTPGGDGRMHLKGRVFDFQPNTGDKLTVRLFPGGGQTLNQLEWYDTGGALTSYVNPAGAITIKPSGGQPACNSATRFMLWTTPGSNGVKDKVEVCAKDSTDAYAWRAIY
ncbi:MAG: hypothetical protein HY236_10020 [Acidobacteria bacterium]|nr:hypothetical protein [Acidobacteriota bacterium]